MPVPFLRTATGAIIVAFVEESGHPFDGVAHPSDGVALYARVSGSGQKSDLITSKLHFKLKDDAWWLWIKAK